MILVIGANGISGRSIVRHLVARGAAVRGLASNATSAATVAELGAEPAIGDIRNVDSLVEAMRGVERVYHICPRMQPDEYAIGTGVIAAAKRAGVDHLVFHSVTPPHLEDVPFHWEKMRVEVALLESGLDFTMLRPTNYMQNLQWTWQRIVAEGIWELPYTPDCVLSWIDIEDLGEAAAIVLTEDGHKGATYEVCGQAPISRHAAAAIISETIGRPVKATKIAIADYFAMPYWHGRKPEDLARLATMFDHYDRVGCNIGNVNVLTMLLRRAPVGYRQFVERFAAERSPVAQGR
jgi:uncharacterized protein YbjT (DUF2867 family)